MEHRIAEFEIGGIIRGDNGDAVRIRHHQEIPDGRLSLCVQIRHRLVEEEVGGIVKQCEDVSDTLLHSGTERTDPVVESACYADTLGNLQRRFGMKWMSTQVGEEFGMFATGVFRVERELGSHIAGQFRIGFFRNGFVITSSYYLAGGEVEDGGEKFEQCSLTRSVLTRNSESISAPERKRNVLQDRTEVIGL